MHTRNIWCWYRKKMSKLSFQYDLANTICKVLIKSTEADKELRYYEYCSVNDFAKG